MRHLVPLALLLIAAPATAFGGGLGGWEAPPGVAPDASPAPLPAEAAPPAPTLEAPTAWTTTTPRPVEAAGATADAGRAGRADTRDPASLGAAVSIAPPEGLPVAALRVEAEARADRWLRGEAAWRAEDAQAATLAAASPADDAPERPRSPSTFTASRHVALTPQAPEGRGAPDASPAPGAPPSATTQAPGARAPPPPGAVAAAAAAAAGALLALLLAPVALHHRLRGARVLAQETRRRAHEMLAERPGAALAQVAAALGVDPKTAAYHLRRLEKEGLVVAEGPPRARRWFLAGALAPEARRRLLAERASPRVLAAVREAPGLTKGALAARLGMARGTLAWHLGRLGRRGLVRVERAGREARVHPLPGETTPGRPEAF